MVRLYDTEVHSHLTPNVVLLSGLHWHVSEALLLKSLPATVSKTITSCRCFVDQQCGASLGIFLLEFDGPSPMYDFLGTRYHTVRGCVGEAHPTHMTSGNWDRSGRLPDLPSRFVMLYDKAVEGFGREGYAVRGVSLCVPNTLTEEGAEAMEVIRKRLRVE